MPCRRRPPAHWCRAPSFRVRGGLVGRSRGGDAAGHRRGRPGGGPCHQPTRSPPLPGLGRGDASSRGRCGHVGGRHRRAGRGSWVGSPTTVGPVSGARGVEGSGDDRSGSSSLGGVSGASPPSGSSGGGDDASGSSGSGGSGSGSTPGGPGPTPTTSAPVQVSATFTAEGGSVGVTCVGTIISRDFVTPAAGFALDPSGSTGPGEVDVRFRSTSDGRQSRIRVTCPDGVPVERVDA